MVSLAADSRSRGEEGRTLFCFGLGAKGVDSEGRGHDAVGDLDGLVEVVNGKDGDQRTEALLDEHGVVRRVDLDEGGLDEALLLIHRAAHEDLALGVVDHALQALEGALVDDARVVGGGFGAVRVELLVGLLELLHDGGDNGAVHQDVVLGGTDLAGVHQLAPEESTRDEPGVGILGDNGRVETTQLEHDGGEVRRGRLGNDATDIGAAGEEDLIPALGEKGLGFGDTALDDGVARRVEGGLDDLLDNNGAVGGVFTRLDNNGVTGRNGTNDRAEGQLEGVVESTTTVGQSTTP